MFHPSPVALRNGFSADSNNKAFPRVKSDYICLTSMLCLFIIAISNKPMHSNNGGWQLASGSGGHLSLHRKCVERQGLQLLQSEGEHLTQHLRVGGSHRPDSLRNSLAPARSHSGREPPDQLHGPCRTRGRTAHRRPSRRHPRNPPAWAPSLSCTSSAPPTTATIFWTTWNPIAATVTGSTSTNLDGKPQRGGGLERNGRRR
jgi:hypothetical protein